MRIEKDKCDSCGKEAEDRYLEIGWIELEAKRISVSLGRRNGVISKDAITAFVGDKRLDFCCQQCLIRYLDKIVSRRKDELSRLEIS